MEYDYLKFLHFNYLKIYGRRMTNDEHNLIKITEFQLDQKVSIVKDLKVGEGKN
jgi:hypothetical protein